jgi:hypothetical protein
VWRPDSGERDGIFTTQPLDSNIAGGALLPGGIYHRILFLVAEQHKQDALCASTAFKPFF